MGSYSDGSTQDLSKAVSWTSSDPMVGDVSNAPGTEGLFTSYLAGTTTVTATSGAISGNTVVNVTGTTLTSITIAPVTSSAALGTLVQFTAMGGYSDGSMQDLTASVTWSSSDPGVATLSNAPRHGRPRPDRGRGHDDRHRQHGSHQRLDDAGRRRADSGGHRPEPADTTAPERTNVQYTATGMYNDGSMQDLTVSVSWKSSSNPTATVGGKGNAKAHKAGVCDITATLGAVVGTTSLTVTP